MGTQHKVEHATAKPTASPTTARTTLHSPNACCQSTITTAVALLVLTAATLLPGCASQATTQGVGTLGEPLPPPPASPPIPDDRITGAVETLIGQSGRVPAADVRVATRDGVVTLEGEVANLLARQRAQQLAKAVKGVRAVLNNIQVRPAFRSDEAIANDVQAALLDDPATESYEIRVATRGGKVTLSGLVDSWQEYREAKRVARGVVGVAKVTNDLVVAQAGLSRPDEEIKHDISSRLAADVHVDHGLISVDVHDGHVTLTGAVGSAAEKDVAGWDAWESGVKSVDNDLEVKWWAREAMRRKQLPLTDDSEIKQAVVTVLKREPGVPSSAITVDVNAGAAKLRGVVRTLRAKRLAEKVTANVVGVTAVRNALRVEPRLGGSDHRIEDSAARAINRNACLRGQGLQVAVENGVARLQGSLPSYLDKQLAERTISAVRGVRAINDQVTIAGINNKINDSAIAASIVRQLEWSPFVSAEGIDVRVDNGVAVLEGTVASSFARKRAEQRAYASGARRVENRLRVTM